MAYPFSYWDRNVFLDFAVNLDFQGDAAEHRLKWHALGVLYWQATQERRGFLGRYCWEYFWIGDPSVAVWTNILLVTNAGGRFHLYHFPETGGAAWTQLPFQGPRAFGDGELNVSLMADVATGLRSTESYSGGRLWLVELHHYDRVLEVSRLTPRFGAGNCSVASVARIQLAEEAIDVCWHQLVTPLRAVVLYRSGAVELLELESTRLEAAGG
jgi:hypothetical protein